MSSIVDRFVSDYLVDRKALADATKTRSPRNLPGWTNPNPWNASSTPTREKNAEWDPLRVILKRHLALAGFNKNYQRAADHFDAQRNAEMDKRASELEEKLIAAELSQLRIAISRQIEAIVSRELHERRIHHREAVHGSRQIWKLMISERFSVLAINEFSIRRQLLKDSLFVTELIKRDETEARWQIQDNNSVHPSECTEPGEPPCEDTRQKTRGTPNTSFAQVSTYSHESLRSQSRSESETSATPFQSSRNPPTGTPTKTSESATVSFPLISPLSAAPGPHPTSCASNRSSNSDESCYLAQPVPKPHAPFIGISLVEIPNEDDSRPIGLIVDAMYVGGPGTRSGMQLGDTIVAVAGKRVQSFLEFRQVLCECAVIGETLPFIVVRHHSNNEDEGGEPFSILEIHVPVMTTDPALKHIGSSVFFEQDEKLREFRKT